MHDEKINQTENLPGRLSDKRKKVKLPPHSKLSKHCIQHLDDFVETVPALRLSQSLRDLFLMHLTYKDGQPDKLHELSADLYFLLQFLDRMGAEMKGKVLY